MLLEEKQKISEVAKSSNVNEVIRADLNSLFLLFMGKSHLHKKHKRHKDAQAKAQKRK